MKRLIVLLILALPCHGQMLQAIVGQSSGVSVLTDSCTSNLLFSWHFENLDVTLGGVAGGVNNGCSLGDTTATATGTPTISGTQYEDGANSGNFAAGNRYYNFDVSSDDIFTPLAGSVDVWVYVSTYLSGEPLINASVDANNKIDLYLQTTSTINQFRMAMKAGGGTTRNADTTFAQNTGCGDTANCLELNTWYHVQAEWDTTTAHSTKYVKICATSNPAQDPVTDHCGTIGSASGTWAGTLTSVQYGAFGAGTINVFLDHLKVYGVWKW